MATSVGFSLTEQGSSDHTLEWLWRRGRFTCYHGEEYKFPPHGEDTLRCGEKNAESMEGYYVAAERLLPVEELPELVDCIHSAGHCIGLADPVLSIIINAVRRLPERHCIDPRRPLRPRTQGWRYIANDSLYGLLGFMAEYFRYLTEIQARRYLHAAHYDLSLAIKLVQYERFSPKLQRPLLPDGGKIQAALRVASKRAGHPDPDDLASIMTAQYPSDLLSSIVTKLRACQQLTADDIWGIRDLLTFQWPPNPMVNLEFLCRPKQHTQDMSDSMLLRVSSCIGQDLIADISIRRHIPLEYISNLTYDCTFMETKLSECLMEATRRRQGSDNHGSTVNYDGQECEHIQSLRMCLLDAIHALYIKALAILPYAAGSSCFLRAFLVAGHCYGLMDPVSNIILSSVWYDINFPPEEQYTTEKLSQTISVIEGIDGILDTRIMSRVEYRSLAGLVFMFHSTYQTISSVHKALEYLYFWNCDLTRIIGTIPHTFDGVARAANHPQPEAFESFLCSLSLEKVNHLRSLLQTKPGGRISHAHWIELREILCNERVSTPVRFDPCYVDYLLPLETRMQISREKSAFVDKLTFIRRELERVLRKYCDQHPWEPSYQLDIICGVHVESKTSYPPRFYHANFLASADDAGGVILPHERTLFFAEFWELPWYAEQSSLSSRCCHDYRSRLPSNSSFSSSCCPVDDYHACVGRCIDCEGALSKIVHPPSGRHSGEKTDGSIGLCEGLYQSATGALDIGTFERQLLQSDIFYFDHHADDELGTRINDYCTKSQMVGGWLNH